MQEMSVAELAAQQHKLMREARSKIPDSPQRTFPRGYITRTNRNQGA